MAPVMALCKRKQLIRLHVFSQASCVFTEIPIPSYIKKSKKNVLEDPRGCVGTLTQHPHPAVISFDICDLTICGFWHMYSYVQLIDLTGLLQVKPGSE